MKAYPIAIIEGGSGTAGLVSSTPVNPQMDPSWLDAVGDELETPVMQSLRSFLMGEVASGRGFFPPAPLVFNALRLTPLDHVRVVILGQDPYHGPGQAMGLSFSVPHGVEQPPSLRNIFGELRNDLGLEPPVTGDLTPWAERGVLLLNSVLTVAPRSAASHAGKGWEPFTDRVISELSARSDGIVFLLWGRYAQQKGSIVDTSRHHVLRAAHPSPLSAHNGFFGCRHFSQANAFLTASGREEVDWRLGGKARLTATGAPRP
jgi:uracil-DNA glycosylase